MYFIIAILILIILIFVWINKKEKMYNVNAINKIIKDIQLAKLNNHTYREFYTYNKYLTYPQFVKLMYLVQVEQLTPAKIKKIISE